MLITKLLYSESKDFRHYEIAPSLHLGLLDAGVYQWHVHLLRKILVVQVAKRKDPFRLFGLDVLGNLCAQVAQLHAGFIHGKLGLGLFCYLEISGPRHYIVGIKAGLFAGLGGVNSLVGLLIGFVFV